MIKHIVLFKLTPFNTEEGKKLKLNEIKTALLGLKDKIDCLLTIEVGFNANPSEIYDLALTTTFKSMNDLNIYAKHPDHLEVAKLIGAVKAERACVDFEY